MRKTAIVMDSTGYLSADILREYDIRIISLIVHIGNEAYQETDLSNAGFFSKLADKTLTFSTSQPSVGSFCELYAELRDKGYEEIISLHLSEKISGTYHSALMAQELSLGIPIHVFDSQSSALGLGFLAWAAADWAGQGLDSSSIIPRLQELRKAIRLFFIVDTLKYLQRGGRIGGAAALLGTILKIKPILYFNSVGMIDVFDKVRSKRKAVKKVITELEIELKKTVPCRIAVFHVGAQEEAQELREALHVNYPIHDIRLFEAGPVIAAHVGPGTIALAYHPWPFEGK